MLLEDELAKIKEFFKRNVIISDFEEILRFKPDTLIGIDQISSEELRKVGINNLDDLANLSKDTPLEIKGILPNIIIKWIKISKLIKKKITEQLRTQKKLLLIGLDNGGKTSILSVLQDKFSIIKSLLPTKGVRREKLEFFGFPIVSWDLGGQVQYREKYYFNKPEIFFTEVDLILYVIDVQDRNRFQESAEYFSQVLEALSDLGENAPILIVLNKSDQDFRKTIEWQKNINAIKEVLSPVLIKFDTFEIDYYDTTIFQKETIMQMFSIALKKVSDTSEIIEHILQEFLYIVNGKAASLISMDGLIFGSYFQTNTDEMLINNTALLLQTLSNFHNSIGLIREKLIKLEFPMNGITIQGEKLFEYSNLQIPVYFWVLLDDPSLIDENIEYFKQQLLPLINLFI
ncbi:MAG: 50S ribosome-binding GTPase [Candidatus Lokiarchaeota archaeon]|nr:50S ribosome-binding GTPase [Candidatus Lokiarchaeota archaeon]